MRILVTGANGQLGQSLQTVLRTQELLDTFVFVDRGQLDLSQLDNIETFIVNNSIDVIINCAAYTMVDQAEIESDIANQINHLAVKELAQIAEKKQIKLVHVSTDYVFDGLAKTPYTEEQDAKPLSAYGHSKLQGEEAIKRIMAHNAIIIRTSWMYSEYGKNFVKTMLTLGQEKDQINVVNDQIGTPTYAADLAHTLIIISQNKYFRQATFDTQLYHYANQGNCSWYEFAKTIFQMTRLSCRVIPISTEQYPLPAKRPLYSVLDSYKIIRDFNPVTPPWKVSLQKCIDLLT